MTALSLLLACVTGNPTSSQSVEATAVERPVTAAAMPGDSVYVTANYESAKDLTFSCETTFFSQNGVWKICGNDRR